MATQKATPKQGPRTIGELWLTITNVRLTVKGTGATVDVQVEGDAADAFDRGPTWLPCENPANDNIKVDKLYDKILDALQNSRKVRGLLKCQGGLYISEVDVRYQS